jgi:hypothetical protein
MNRPAPYGTTRVHIGPGQSADSQPKPEHVGSPWRGAVGGVPEGFALSVLQERPLNAIYADVAREPFQLWELPDVHHTAAIREKAGEYERRSSDSSIAPVTKALDPSDPCATARMRFVSVSTSTSPCLTSLMFSKSLSLKLAPNRHHERRPDAARGLATAVA